MSTEHAHTTPAGDWVMPVPSAPRRAAVELQNGDAMTREEFHRLYRQTPDGFKAELIGGIVYVASPLKLAHGRPHLLLGALLAAYEGATPGVEASDNTTVLLGDEGEPQPDLFLRVLPEYGGLSSTDEEGYVAGAPEFIIEVAVSSRAIDLHSKKRDYARYGVREYLVHCVKEQTLQWFDLAADAELQPDAARVYQMRVFPGLWINGPALLAHDYAALMATLNEGLATDEHAAFVAGLAQQAAAKRGG
jgi:Uma2 family endonuclease